MPPGTGEARCTVAENAFTKQGYAFVGWSETPEGPADSKYNPGQTLELSDGDKTLYAIWTINSSTLTLDAKEGTYPGNVTYTQDYGTTLTVNTPVVPTGKQVYFDTHGGTAQNPIQQNVTFNAWTLTATGDGSFEGNTYTFGLSNRTLQASYNYENVALPTAPTKQGYTFAGWYQNADYTGDPQTTDITGKLTNDITLHAKWQINASTLTVDPNSGTFLGSSESTNITQNYGTTYEVANPTAPTGYTVSFNTHGGTEVQSITQTVTFDGWTLTGEGDGSFLGNTFTFGNNNRTLKANYVRNPITLPTGEGQAPTKEGYNFEGWFTEETGGTALAASYTPNSNITLHAKWSYTQKQLEITANPSSARNNRNKK